MTTKSTSFKYDVALDPALFMEHDLSSEDWRDYEFPSGYHVVVNKPLALYTHRIGSRSWGGMSHRILLENGAVDYIPPGWIRLTWRNKDGLPRMQF